MGPKRLWPDPEHDTFSLERNLRRQGHHLVAGLDEAGRGPLAGPVIAACVVLPVDCNYQEFVDSKTITHTVRLRLYEELKRGGAVVGLGKATEEDIDRYNILQASLFAMKMAIESLPILPDFLLVDGNCPVPVSIPQKTMIKGESKSASIAAASIAAKVTRDALMETYHIQFPVYNFCNNKGYPTEEHRSAIKKHGPCEIHRKTFKGVREYVTGRSSDEAIKEGIHSIPFS